MSTTLRFDQPAPLLNLNDRQHWAARYRRNEAWREAAYYAACQLGSPAKRRHPRSLVIATLPVRSLKIRRDAHNFVATLKPIIDGLVTAGVWPDDDGEWVVTGEPRFHQGREVIIILTPWDV